MRSSKAIALISFAFTYLFFFEYLPPARWVHIPFDLKDFHFPLADYAFTRIRQGHFPLWDPTIYCGMSFAGNIQAALFYPPTWLMFLFDRTRERLSYQAMQDLLLLHVWLGSLLCFLWLRQKRLAALACAMGTLVFAFSGYMCSQLQHFGMVAAYSWTPLALWGVDEAAERESWAPMWKIAVASAMAFLAGYPPTWVVLATVVTVYSLAGEWRWKAGLGTVAALAFSLPLCAIQFLPTWETAALRLPEMRYGIAWKSWDVILSYLLPNYFNFGLKMPVVTNPGNDYFYLGIPALFGLPFLFRRRFRDLAPPLAVLGATLILAGNPFNLVLNVIQRSTLLPDVVRAWYFLAGVTLAFAGLTAYAVDRFLAAKKSVPSGLLPVSAALMTLRGAQELYRWKHDLFVAGWRSVFDLFLTLAIFCAGICAFRAVQGWRRTCLGIAVVLFTAIDYKAFGTSKRFNADAGEVYPYSSKAFRGMEDNVYQQLRADRQYRVIIDNETGPDPDNLRHIGLTTPQGFDPLLTIQLRKVAETYGSFVTDRLFDIDLNNQAGLQMLGVKYVISSEFSKQFPKLKDNPRYRLLGSVPAFYQVYEYLDARPPYSWEGNPADTTEARAWDPERRTFLVHATSGGKLALHEQFFPGWTATIDGKRTAVESWAGAFQAVAVPPGEHIVEFRYRSRLLALGGGISLVSLIVLLFWVRASSGNKSDTAYRAALE